MTLRQVVVSLRRRHPAAVGAGVGAALVLVLVVAFLAWATWQSLFVSQDPVTIGPLTQFFVVVVSVGAPVMALAVGIGALVGQSACFILRKTGCSQ